MSRFTIRAKKGMVFWYDDNVYNKYNSNFKLGDKEFKSFVEAGKRPYLVVSDDNYNINSRLVNIAPITSSTTSEYFPSHLSYTKGNDVLTIKLDQIRTVDTIALGTYMYTLSDEIMKDVEHNILIQFGIQGNTEDLLNNLLNTLSPTLEKIIKERLEKIQSKLTLQKADDFAILIGQNIEMLFQSEDTIPKVKNNNIINDNLNNNEIEEIPDTDTDTMDVPDLTEDDLVEDTKEVDNNQQEATIKTTKEQLQEIVEETKELVEETKEPNIRENARWDTEKIEQFLKDCETYSNKEVAAMYNMKLATLYTTKYQLKKNGKLLTGTKKKKNIETQTNDKKNKVNEPIKEVEQLEPKKDNITRTVIHWDKPTSQQFLDDCEKYSFDEIAKLWNMSLRNVYRRKYKSKVILGLDSNGEE